MRARASPGRGGVGAVSPGKRGPRGRSEGCKRPAPLPVNSRFGCALISSPPSPSSPDPPSTLVSHLFPCPLLFPVRTFPFSRDPVASFSEGPTLCRDLSLLPAPSREPQGSAFSRWDFSALGSALASGVPCGTRCPGQDRMLW